MVCGGGGGGGGFERKNKRDWREEERSPFHLGIFKTIYIENGLTS